MYKYIILVLITVSIHIDAFEYCPDFKENLTPQKIENTQRYIKNTWPLLTRTHQQLFLAAQDPKLGAPPDGHWIIYIPAKLSLPIITSQLKAAMPATEFEKIKILKLPNHYEDINQHGLLYLPNSYVVPGGQFNEMYGWDSYFIVLGLLQDNKIKLAQNMVDNFVFEIENYGKILNANRTYYLTRSQPPLFTEMALAVYAKNQNQKWLANTLPAAIQFYNYWTSPPRLIRSLGLSRYYSEGSGPVPEIAKNQQLGSNYYEDVKNHYRSFPVQGYDLKNFYNSKTNDLTPAFYMGDRSVRESGFDISNKFGAFGADITHYAPVDLNTLLYQMEMDIAHIYQIMNQPDQSAIWAQKAKKRAALINQYLWDNALGYYFDYNFVTHQTRPYIFPTTFYPLWAGIANQTQAQRILANLPSLEAPGGIVTSAYVTGDQWDAPFGWAPLQYFAVEGLNRYGFQQDAKRLSQKFISLVNQEQTRYGAIVEKYNVRDCSSRLKIQYGYHTNEIGFGWTNGVYLELLSLFKQGD